MQLVEVDYRRVDVSSCVARRNDRRVGRTVQCAARCVVAGQHQRCGKPRRFS